MQLVSFLLLMRFLSFQSTSFLFLKSAFDELNSHVAFHPAVHGYQWLVTEGKPRHEGTEREQERHIE